MDNNADDKIRLNLLKRLQADQAAIDKYIQNINKNDSH